MCTTTVNVSAPHTACTAARNAGYPAGRIQSSRKIGPAAAFTYPQVSG